MIIYIPFTIMLVFVLAYYFAFEYCRYKTAKMMAVGLGGRAVFKLGGSYMSRVYAGLEERAWIVPDDKMAWGSLLTVLTPSMGKFFLWRKRDPGFRFYIEPKTGLFFRTLYMDTLKEDDFKVPQLDEGLRLRTNNHLEAYGYFGASEKQQALTALFLDGCAHIEGFTQLKGDHDGITATMQGISIEDLSPERIDLFFKHLRRF